MKIKMTFALLLIAFVSASPSFAIEPVSKCDALAAWAAALEKLPTDYEAFVALEPDQRRAVYTRLSEAQRAGLWQEQLSRALARDVWNDAQRALIAETRAFLNSANFVANGSGAGSLFETVQSKAAALEAEAFQEFSRAEAQQLFLFLGPKAAFAGKRGGDPPPACDCRISNPGDCVNPPDCYDDGVCRQALRCGLGWMAVCDSLCAF